MPPRWQTEAGIGGDWLGREREPCPYTITCGLLKQPDKHEAAYITACPELRFDAIFMIAESYSFGIFSFSSE
jgi:hypothetical protein